MNPAILSPDPAEAFDIPEGCRVLECSNSPDDPDCSIAKAMVPPGVTTRWHFLAGTAERYVILEGRGRVEVGVLAPREVGPGDVVLIQFGHNDNGSRAPLKGIGEEVEERENATTKQRGPMHTWGWYLRRYVAEARAKGATPVICSLIPRKIWREGKIARTSDSHADWARAVAQAEGVVFIDLHERIAARYDELGPEPVNAFFADERVHTKIGRAHV